MGGGLSLTAPQRYREEYLVDTETNEIIYPKVLPSSITNIPNGSDNDQIKIPLFGSSIDPSTFYYSGPISVSGIKCTQNANTTIYKIPIPSTGIWFVQGAIVFGQTTSYTGYSSCTMNLTHSSNVIVSDYLHNNNTYARHSISGIFLSDKEDDVVNIVCWYVGASVTLNSASLIRYSRLKLCDI